MKSTVGKWLRWILPLAVLVVMGIFFRDELDFLSDGFRTLRHAQPWPIVVVFITFAFSLLAMAEVMRKLFVAGGVPVSFKECNNIVFASNAWSTTLPGGPAFAAILTYKVQRAWGASVVLCGWFFVLSSAISTLWVVLIGFTGVFFWGADVALWSLVVSLASMLCLCGGLYWASCNTRTVERWITNLPWKKTNKLVEHVNKLDQVSLNLGQFSWVTLMAFFNRAFDAVALWACAWAVTGNMPSFWPADDHTTIMGISVAFITAKLAGSAQITPAGVGTVEIAIITALVATGMTAVDATGTVLVYRLITFVFYSAIGWVIYFAYYARKGMSYAALRQTDSEETSDVK